MQVGYVANSTGALESYVGCVATRGGENLRNDIGTDRFPDFIIAGARGAPVDALHRLLREKHVACAAENVDDDLFGAPRYRAEPIPLDEQRRWVKSNYHRCGDEERFLGVPRFQTSRDSLYRGWAPERMCEAMGSEETRVVILLPDPIDHALAVFSEVLSPHKSNITRWYRRAEAEGSSAEAEASKSSGDESNTVESKTSSSLGATGSRRPGDRDGVTYDIRGFETTVAVDLAVAEACGPGALVSGSDADYEKNRECCRSAASELGWVAWPGCGDCHPDLEDGAREACERDGELAFSPARARRVRGTAPSILPSRAGAKRHGGHRRSGGGERHTRARRRHRRVAALRTPPRGSRQRHHGSHDVAGASGGGGDDDGRRGRGCRERDFGGGDGDGGGDGRVRVETRRLIGIVAGVVAGVVVGHLRRLRRFATCRRRRGRARVVSRARTSRGGRRRRRRRRSRRRYFQLSPPRVAFLPRRLLVPRRARVRRLGLGRDGAASRRFERRRRGRDARRDSDADRKPARAAMGRYFVADPAFGDATIPDALRRRLVRFYDPLVDDLNALLGNGETRWWDADGASTPALQRETLVAASSSSSSSNGRRGVRRRRRVPRRDGRRRCVIRRSVIRRRRRELREWRRGGTWLELRVGGTSNAPGERRRRRRGAFVSVSRGERAPFARSVLRRFDSAMSRVDGRVRHGATRCCDEEWVGAISTGGSDDGGGDRGAARRARHPSSASRLVAGGSRGSAPP